ncbi:MAG: hypothetical protein ED859_12665 [Desulfuromonadales bacterium]|nr:MAG: hypothetical protein ED859_12665 [Desulfuromonadales bacterium]
MNIAELKKNANIKLLSLFLAVVLWASVTSGRTGELELRIALKVDNVSSGLSVAGPEPKEVVVTVSGPKILLLKLSSEKIIMPLDVKGVGEGTAMFTGFERKLHLPREVAVTRVFPTTVEVRLSRLDHGGAERK